MENVGRLKPGSQYIYERDGATVYAREFGTNERFVIGYDWTPDNGLTKPTEEEIRRIEYRKIMDEVLKEAQDNPALQDALDRVRIIYELSKENKTVPHHPV
jgi:hypothetical protein